MDTKNILKITVGGQTYNLVTNDRTREAKELAADLDKKVTRLMKENAGCTYTQAVVLAALDYAQTAKHASESEEKLRSEVRAYLEDSAKAKTERDKANRELERLKLKLKRSQSTSKSSLWGTEE
ncbi:MAG: cell division protein ZapA [Ruminococcaceae bacterium]|nr:cell division protein ZapA [Oscillospiraceae bacterium]